LGTAPTRRHSMVGTAFCRHSSALHLPKSDCACVSRHQCSCLGHTFCFTRQPWQQIGPPFSRQQISVTKSDRGKILAHNKQLMDCLPPTSLHPGTQALLSTIFICGPHDLSPPSFWRSVSSSTTLPGHPALEQPLAIFFPSR
jgi:hypothetical protein